MALAKKKDPKNTRAPEGNLDAALAQIDRTHGAGSIMRLGDKKTADIGTISTGAMSLDVALGIPGVPRGRIVEIYGAESSGKTTVCLSVVANAQRNGGIAAFVDTEHALDPSYARLLGVNTQDLLVSQPDCGEDALNIAETLVRSNAIDVLVIDSVAALVPRAEIEGQMGDSHVGLQARLMSQALRKLTGAISRGNTCVIFTNQTREKIGVMYGNPTTTTGGNALKFYASVRMEIRRAEIIKDSSQTPIGNRVVVKVVKNKLAPPFQQASFDIMYGEGISKAGSILDVATDLKIIDKKGAWFSFDGTLIGQGREQSKVAIKEDPELEKKLVTAINEKLKPEVEAEPEAKSEDKLAAAKN
ncbi:MAG TPA: recombinase RecA [Lentisphaeria bacterium]|jgi:recombination protein RecA|nr:recombinase RecA [Lentisphaeria bacterium]